VQNPEDKETKMEKRGKRTSRVGSTELGGLFKTLGSFLDLVSEMIERGEEEFRREGEISLPSAKGLRAVYGFSVKLGAGGKPTVETFGNVPRMTAKGPIIEKSREPLVDVFDEDDSLHVVAELPGVNESDLKIEVEEDILLISAETPDRKYHKETLLPTPVRAAEMQSSFKNGILELHLKKKKLA